MTYRRTYALGAIALLVIAFLYWPVIHFNFVWDDWQSFHDRPWLIEGDLWKHYILRDFNYWEYYFRPLVVGFFALQLHVFGSSPGPMHAISLALHLIDVALVGVLAWRCATQSQLDAARKPWLVPLCMLLYGLHPALIETVAWIGCQFELVLILFVLLGLVANISIQKPWLRAGVVAMIFFLAACSKEAALSFPLLLALFDWMLFSGGKNLRFIDSVMTTLRHNWRTYLGIALSGIAYLAFRHWALGAVTSNFYAPPAPPLARVWEISTVYLHYLQVITWPISSMSPIHPYEPQDFLGQMPPESFLAITLALVVAGGGLYLTLARKSSFGGMIVAATAALLPVLHIIPVEFEANLYHERYASLALATICAMVPMLRRPTWLKWRIGILMTRPAATIAVFFWFAFSIIGIRIVLPNWANDVTLWTWVLSSHPHDPQPKSNLLFAYLKTKNYAAGRQFGDKVLADPTPCTVCMLNIAQLALLQHDPDRAAIALERARNTRQITADKQTLRTYYLLTGQMLMQQGKKEDAQNVLRAALSLTPEDTEIKELLNIVLTQSVQPAPVRP
ncbi:lipopolysaccharide assembly protein LapB [Dyella sp. C9]|uniref:tetratricopeptide repeat protein n=1 Tax=Dyella sp. C9 TaxID=2202154 RepID=UPI000DF00325|nr:hypothetical protein [Dyella sp. C9]